MFVSGIGCSGAVHLTTWTPTGSTAIHGRAPAIATGHRDGEARPERLGRHGDGDALSIGGNHLIHALRRNVNLKILLFNNQIYGLDEGPVLADPGGGEGHEVDTVRLGRSSLRSGRARAGRRGHLRGADDRQRSQASDGGPASGRGAPRRGVRGDLPELQRVQRRRVRPAPGQDAGGAQPDPARPRRAHRVRRGHEVRPAGGERAPRDRRTVADTDPDAIITHDVHGPPSLAFTLAHLSQGPTEPTCMGVFRQVERDTSTARRSTRRSAGEASGSARAICTDCSTAAIPGRRG